MYRASVCVWLVVVCGWPRAGWAERPSLARARKLARLATGLEQEHSDWSIMFDGRQVHVVGKRGQKVKASTVERVLRDQLDALRIEDWLTWAEGAPAAQRGAENEGAPRVRAGKLVGGIAHGERMYAWPVNRAGPKGTWRRGVLVVTVRLDGLPTVREFYVSRFDGHTPGAADEVSVSAWGQRVVVPEVKQPSRRAAPIVLPRRDVRHASEPGAILATAIDDSASYPYREAMQQTKGRRRLPRAPTVRKAFEGPRHGAARSPFRAHSASR